MKKPYYLSEKDKKNTPGLRLRRPAGKSPEHKCDNCGCLRYSPCGCTRKSKGGN